MDITVGTKTTVHINNATHLLRPTGKYVPALAYTIHLNNPTAELKVNLQGKNTLHILWRKDRDKVNYYIRLRRYVH